MNFLTASGLFGNWPRLRTLCLPSAKAAVIVSACTSKPKYRVFFLMTDSSFVALRLSFFAETERNPRLRRASVVPS
jgi:hypothetical protein